MFARLFGRGSAAAKEPTDWTVAVSASGDVLVALPRMDLLLAMPVLSVASDGGISVRDAGRKQAKSIQLANPQKLDAVRKAQSVIVAMITNGYLSFAVAPVVRKGQKPQIFFKKGKIHRVTVDRCVDDGSATGVWRGHVTLHDGVSDVFVELTPVFPITAGMRLRIVGSLEAVGQGSDGRIRMRFRHGAWVPLSDRAALFSEGKTVRLEASSIESADGMSMEATLAELSAMNRREARTKAATPMVRIPINGNETTAQRGLRSRLEAGNAGVQRFRPPTGKRMRMASTDWHGAVQKNGDIIIELRIEPFVERPEKLTVIISDVFVTTADGLPSRIGIRSVFRDGTATTLLLGGGPQEIAAEIARRRSVVVVQGMAGSETYAEVSVSVADVAKR
ncbi:hypothetical protein G6L37_03175 [Agrobacterium rubi]|nr:hypothetical protein [Agrobacterium rubi]NTF24377.1 hypothetical protein [Agrobacterium rubi]